MLWKTRRQLPGQFAFVIVQAMEAMIVEKMRNTGLTQQLSDEKLCPLEGRGDGGREIQEVYSQDVDKQVSWVMK